MVRRLCHFRSACCLSKVDISFFLQMQGWIWRWANHLFQLSAILFVLFYFYRCVVLLDVIYINLRHHRRVVISIDSSSLIRINQHLVIVLGAYYCWSRRGVQCRGTDVDGSHVIIDLCFWSNSMRWNYGSRQNRTLLVLNLAPSRPSRQFKTNDLAKDETQRIVRRLWRQQCLHSPVSSLQRKVHTIVSR